VSQAWLLISAPCTASLNASQDTFVSFFVEKIKGETKVILERLTKDGKHLKQKDLTNNFQMVSKDCLLPHNSISKLHVQL